MTKADIVELYTSTLSELSSMCPQRLPDVFGGIDGYYVGDYRSERAENNSYLDLEHAPVVPYTMFTAY